MPLVDRTLYPADQYPDGQINGDWDGICDITRTRLGDSMRQTCPKLTVTNLQGAHWLPLERKAETIAAIRSWLRSAMTVS